MQTSELTQSSFVLLAGHGSARGVVRTDDSTKVSTLGGVVGKYDGATVEVINWEKYNPRTDAKRPNWFRLENTLATGPGFHDLDCEQKWLWIVILSLVSQKNGESVEWKSSYVQALTGIKPKKQDETLEVFEKFVRLRVSRNVTSRDSHATDTTDGRTDITDKTNYSSERFEKPLEAVISCFQSLSETFRERSVTEKVQQSWIEAFPDSEWITEEIRKALAWELANPIRRKKNFFPRS